MVYRYIPYRYIVYILNGWPLHLYIFAFCEAFCITDTCFYPCKQILLNKINASVSHTPVPLSYIKHPCLSSSAQFSNDRRLVAALHALDHHHGDVALLAQARAHVGLLVKAAGATEFALQPGRWVEALGDQALVERVGGVVPGLGVPAPCRKEER